MIRIISSLFRTVAQAVQNDPEIQRLITRHPFLFRFIKKRLTRDEAFGLSLTIGSFCAGLFMYFFFVIVRKLLQEDALIQTDINAISLVQLLHAQSIDPYLLITALLGSRDVVFAGTILVTIILAFARLRRRLILLMVGIGVSSLGSFLIRELFEKARPTLATPSLQDSITVILGGHAFIAFTFYGICGYFLFQQSKHLLQKILACGGTLFLLLSISLGRIYFELEWPSDVVASLASAATLLSILITVLNINKKTVNEKSKIPYKLPLFLQCTSAVFFLVWVGFIVFLYVKHPPITKNPEPQIPIQIIENAIPQTLFQSLPRRSETLFGAPTEPINIIIVAKEETLFDALKKAGWRPSDPITIGNLWRVIIALVMNAPYDHAPATPTFWNTRINTFSYQKATKKLSARERHHLHIWKTSFITQDGKSVWLCTAHFDIGIKLKTRIIVPTHSIDPAIDKERQGIHADLLGTGYVKRELSFPIVEPTLGKNTAGDTFFTDGKADVLFLENVLPL